MSEAPLYMLDDFWPMPEGDKFCRPKWDEIAQVIQETREGVEQGAAWREVRERWVGHTVEVFNTYIKDPGPWDKIYRAVASEHQRDAHRQPDDDRFGDTPVGEDPEPGDGRADQHVEQRRPGSGGERRHAPTVPADPYGARSPEV